MKDIEQAVEKMRENDTVGFMKDMQGIIQERLNNNETFKALSEELEKYVDFTDNKSQDED